MIGPCAQSFGSGKGLLSTVCISHQHKSESMQIFSPQGLLFGYKEWGKQKSWQSVSLSPSLSLYLSLCCTHSQNTWKMAKNMELSLVDNKTRVMHFQHIHNGSSFVIVADNHWWPWQYGGQHSTYSLPAKHSKLKTMNESMKHCPEVWKTSSLQ